jgi:hypothetical protein
VVAVVVVVAMAADQPAVPPQAQMVRFVAHFVVFTPKHASILGDGSDPNKAYPRLEVADPGRETSLMAKTPTGYPLLLPFERVRPDLGPFDAFKSLDRVTVEEALIRIDDRWEYHVLTLKASGPIGSLLGDAGRLGPFPLKTPGGEVVGPDATTTFVLGLFVHVDKLLEGGYALGECAQLRHEYSDAAPGHTTRGSAFAVELGACTDMGAESAAVVPYQPPDRGAARPVVRPGILLFETVEIGSWEKGS